MHKNEEKKRRGLSCFFSRTSVPYRPAAPPPRRAAADAAGVLTCDGPLIADYAYVGVIRMSPGLQADKGSHCDGLCQGHGDTKGYSHLRLPPEAGGDQSAASPARSITHRNPVNYGCWFFTSNNASGFSGAYVNVGRSLRVHALRRPRSPLRQPFEPRMRCARIRLAIGTGVPWRGTWASTPFRFGADLILSGHPQAQALVGARCVYGRVRHSDIPAQPVRSNRTRHRWPHGCAEAL